MHKYHACDHEDPWENPRVPRKNLLLHLATHGRLIYIHYTLLGQDSVLLNYIYFRSHIYRTLYPMKINLVKCLSKEK